MKELINDKRLTPTMTRTRSGTKQIFTEQGDSVYKVEIEHPVKKSMYAELIDSKWYWIEGCAECKGEPRNWMTYVECDEHNVCRVCSKQRSEAKQPHWGGKNGWTCADCKESEDLDRRVNAFAKLEAKGGLDYYTHNYVDEIICPHCGSELSNDEVYQDEELECFVCNGKLNVEVTISRSFSTSVIGEKVTE